MGGRGATTSLPLCLGNSAGLVSLEENAGQVKCRPPTVPGARDMDPTSFAIPIPPHGETTARLYRSADPAGPCLVLAHGAGAGQQHPFMTATARELAARGVDVITFDFLYMHAGKRGPDRPAVLEATWRAVVGEVRRRALPSGGILAIGGKSMGGRIASQVLASRSSDTATDWDSPAGPDSPRVGGLVLLGYPLHPPGQPGKLRTAHLPQLTTPTLVVQGSRDEFGGEAEVRSAFEM